MCIVLLHFVVIICGGLGLCMCVHLYMYIRVCVCGVHAWVCMYCIAV